MSLPNVSIVGHDKSLHLRWIFIKLCKDLLQQDGLHLPEQHAPLPQSDAVAHRGPLSINEQVGLHLPEQHSPLPQSLAVAHAGPLSVNSSRVNYWNYITNVLYQGITQTIQNFSHIWFQNTFAFSRCPNHELLRAFPTWTNNTTAIPPFWTPKVTWLTWSTWPTWPMEGYNNNNNNNHGFVSQDPLGEAISYL